MRMSNNLTYNIKKYAEIMSFAYFQASIQFFRTHDYKYFLTNAEDRIVISENDSNEEKAKILPNGRVIRSLSGINTVEKNISDAQDVINSHSVYQLGSELKTTDKENFEDFENFVLYLQNQGVNIEIYLPSWYPMIYDYFEKSENYSGVFELEKLIREFGNNNNITIHGSYDPKKCGVSIEDYDDWNHLTADKMLENYNVILSK